MAIIRVSKGLARLGNFAISAGARLASKDPKVHDAADVAGAQLATAFEEGLGFIEEPRPRKRKLPKGNK